MADVMRQGGKKGRKLGRDARHPSHAAYKRNNTRFKNKLKRVRQSNGLRAAAEYERLYKRFAA